MADTLTTTIFARVLATYVRDLDITDAVDPLNVDEKVEWASGTGANQANRVWRDQRSLTNTSENLDLAGSLSSAFGDTLTFARVKLLYVKNNGSDTTLSLGAAGANPWPGPFGDTSDILVVRAGGQVLLWAPDATAYAVTAGTGDILKVERTGTDTTDNTYDIVIVGASA